MPWNKIDSSSKNIDVLCNVGLIFNLKLFQGRGSGGIDSPTTPRRGKGGGRGRKKANHSFDPIPGETDKPFGCERKYNFSAIIKS